jgi:hypothetical protein
MTILDSIPSACLRLRLIHGAAIAGLSIVPSRIETEALQLLDSLYAATSVRPQQWRLLGGLRGATDEALQHAVDEGWMIVEGRHSVFLTDKGRRAKG